MARNLFFILFFIFWLQSYAQDTIEYLDEIRLADVKLKSNSTGQFVKTVDSAALQRSEPLLTNVLKFHSPYFFRENGYGMVSSVSVRGTGASQTAVVWNGININSQFTGQTDFNTINAAAYDAINVRPGGGSVVYGSGAIGGTVHLHDDFQFNGANSQRLNIGYGSFETYSANYSGNFSSDQTAIKIKLSGIDSQNDYPYKGTDRSNTNGDFSNYSLNASAAHWIAKDHLLKIYSSYNKGDRGFSGTMNIPSNSKYLDRNSRNLLEWKYLKGRWSSSLKTAFLKEEFRYFENRDREAFTYGDAKTAIFKYDLGFKWNRSNRIHFIADHTRIDGKGSGITDNNRQTTGLAVLYNGRTDNLQYEASFRQEFTPNFGSPLLINIGSEYRFSENYQLSANFSRNYRIPTFNDLFWSSGGNADLHPERSVQGEIGQSISLKKVSFRLNVFYISIRDLIRWVPSEEGIWKPENTDEAENYGLEFFADFATKIGKNQLEMHSTYAYTKAIDLANQNQLIYTPLHKATLTGTYQIGNLEIFFQSLYNGKIFTSSDNNYELAGYYLADFGAGFPLLKKPATKLQIQANNIFGKEYQSMPSRIMPGRNYKALLTINF